jgi:hypothetical protein
MPGKSAKHVFALDVPGIHVFVGSEIEDVDGRDKPGHDDVEKLQPSMPLLLRLEP